MGGAEPNEADEVATYVAGMAGEMARLSQRQGFKTLAYLLEMARLEARGLVRRPCPEVSPALTEADARPRRVARTRRSGNAAVDHR
ncbi:hypothetical protein ACLBXM_09405 [Xanthobacteraceae bacterium A53D]